MMQYLFVYFLKGNISIGTSRLVWRFIIFMIHWSSRYLRGSFSIFGSPESQSNHNRHLDTSSNGLSKNSQFPHFLVLVQMSIDKPSSHDYSYYGCQWRRNCCTCWNQKIIHLSSWLPRYQFGLTGFLGSISFLQELNQFSVKVNANQKSHQNSDEMVHWEDWNTFDIGSSTIWGCSGSIKMQSNEERKWAKIEVFEDATKQKEVFGVLFNLVSGFIICHFPSDVKPQKWHNSNSI